MKSVFIVCALVLEGQNNLDKQKQNAGANELACNFNTLFEKIINLMFQTFFVFEKVVTLSYLQFSYILNLFGEFY